MNTCSSCGTQAADGQQACARCGAPLASAADQPGYGQNAQPQQPQYGPPPGQPQQPQQPQPQYGQPQYDQPQPGQPQYGQPQYGPTPGQPLYGQPQYGPTPGQPPYGQQPQYGPPPGQYSQPQYSQPQYSQPQYGQQPQYAQPGFGAPGAGITWRSGQLVAGRPLEVVVIVGLIAYAAAVFLWNGIKFFFNTFELFNFSATYGFAFMLVSLILIVIGASIAGVALMVYRGDPAGRILALVAAGVLLFQIIYSSSAQHTSLDVWTILMILALAAWSAGVLTLPAVADWFSASPLGAGRPAPDDVIVAQRTSYLLGGLLALFTLLGFLIAGEVSNFTSSFEGSSSTRAYIYAVLLLAATVAVLIGARMVINPASAWTGRLLLSGVCVAALIVLFLQDSPGAVGFLIGLCVVPPVTLWAREPVRAYFDAQRPAGSRPPGPGGEWSQGWRG